METLVSFSPKVMSGITIPGRIPTPLLSLLNYRRNYGVCIVKRGRLAQCRRRRRRRPEREPRAKHRKREKSVHDRRTPSYPSPVAVGARQKLIFLTIRLNINFISRRIILIVLYYYLY